MVSHCLHIQVAFFLEICDACSQKCLHATLDAQLVNIGGLGTFDRFGRRHSRNSSPRLHNSRYGFEFYGSHRGGYGDRDPSKGRIEFDDFAESDMFEDRYHRWGDGRDYDSMRRRRNANSHGYDSFGDYGGLVS